MVSAIIIQEFNPDCQIALATKTGKIKKTKINDFNTPRYFKPLIAIKLQENDKLIAAKLSAETDYFMPISNRGKVCKYHNNQIPVYGLKSAGVKGMKLNDKEFLSAFVIANNSNVIGLISSRGHLKRIKVSLIPLAAKNTKGNFLFNQLKGNPHLIIDAKKISLDSIIIFNVHNKLEMFNIKEINLTSTKEGLSRAFAGSNKGRILETDFIDNTSCQKNINNWKEDFKKAEETIEKIKDFDIDALIKKT